MLLLVALEDALGELLATVGSDNIAESELGHRVAIYG